MNYLNPTFTVPAPDKQMPGTCEACVWGRGEHAEGCGSRAYPKDVLKFYIKSTAAAIAQKVESDLLTLYANFSHDMVVQTIVDFDGNPSTEGKPVTEYRAWIET